MRLTIKDIAKMAGVSPGTVSKVINDSGSIAPKTKNKILKVIEDTGYRPSFSAKSLATRRSNLIGLIYAGEVSVEFNHPFFSQIINAFKDEIGMLGYDILVFSNKQISNGVNNYIDKCRHFQLDGCLVIAGEYLENSVYELDESNIPCVGIDVPLSGPNSSYVMTDNKKVSSKVIEYLYLHSIKEIAFIGGPDDSFISGIRKKGFLNSMNQFGMIVHEEWMKYGNYTEQAGYGAMKEILEERPYPEAVFAASDMMALGAIRAIKEKGLKVPQDIKVIGCDDIDACRYSDPPLATVMQDKEKMGRFAARMLNDIVNGDNNLSPVLVDPEFIPRDSCLAGSYMKANKRLGELR